MEGDSDVKHLVIGHSQIRNLENYGFPDKPELNFEMEFKSYSGAKAPYLARLIKEELKNNTTPLRITAIIWQNSITDISLEEMEEIVIDMEQFLEIYPYHRVAFPECQYVPKLNQYWEKISRLNTILNDYNIRQGLGKYGLDKVTMSNEKGKGRVVRQTCYKEYNMALTSQNSKGGTHGLDNLGYHIDEGAPKSRYALHIRKYHLYGFKANNRANTTETPTRKSRGIFFTRTPTNTMRKPETADARSVINRIRAHKMISTPEETSLPRVFFSEENTPPAVDDNSSDASLPKEESPDEQVKKDMTEWFQQGIKKGYVDGLKDAIINNYKKGGMENQKSERRRKHKKKQKKASVSSSSDEDDQIEKLRKKGRRKRKYKEITSTSDDSSDEEQVKKKKKKKKMRQRTSSTSNTSSEEEKQKKKSMKGKGKKSKK